MLPAFGHAAPVGGTSQHVRVDGCDPLTGIGRAEEVDAFDPAFDAFAVIGRSHKAGKAPSQQRIVLAQRTLVIGTKKRQLSFRRQQRDQMPDVGGLFRVAAVDADSTAAHLVGAHKAADKACQHKGIDTRRVPSFAEQGLGSYKDMQDAALKGGGQQRHSVPAAALSGQNAIAAFPQRGDAARDSALGGKGKQISQRGVRNDNERPCQ